MKYVAEIGSGPDGSWGIEQIRKGHHCYFVEPNPASFQSLISNTRDLNKYLITYCNFVISNARTITWFVTNMRYPNASHSLDVPTEFKDIDENHVTNRFLVGTMDFNSFLGLQNFDIIRLDIEGSESIIFDGVNAEILPPELHIEFHSKQGLSKVVKQLEELDYRVGIWT